MTVVFIQNLINSGSVFVKLKQQVSSASDEVFLKLLNSDDVFTYM